MPATDKPPAATPGDTRLRDRECAAGPIDVAALARKRDDRMKVRSAAELESDYPKKCSAQVARHHASLRQQTACRQRPQLDATTFPAASTTTRSAPDSAFICRSTGVVSGKFESATIVATSSICDSIRAFAARTASHAPSPLTDTTVDHHHDGHRQHDLITQRPPHRESSKRESDARTSIL